MERVGKYELHEKLGEGGFGRVWKAFDTDLRVWRALKEPFDQSPELEAELGEARVQAQMDHAGVVRLLTTERLDGRFFLVMEYVAGETLRQRLEHDPKPPLETADSILRSVLQALGYAHRRGVVHLDLKPENLFILPGDEVKIGDFGLARVVDRALVTVTSTRGTLLYMAPEQLDGKAGPSVDLWAVGAIAYELYTGARAVSGETQGEVMRNVAAGRVSDLSLVPESRRDFVASLLQPDPDARCPSADQALRRLGTPGSAAESAPTAELLASTPRPASGSRGGALAAAVALGVILALAGFGYGAWVGLIDLPLIEALFLRLEPEPEAPRPTADFFGLGPAERLDQAWEYADAADFARAFRAVEEILRSGAAEEISAEALFLRANLGARHLERPWHAVADLQAYLAAHSAGRYAVPAQILLAELYIDLDRPQKGLTLLDHAVRTHADDPLVGDALALADRCEERVRRGRVSDLEAGDRLLASLVPNNLPSLILAFLSFSAFLLPGVFSLGTRVRDESQADSARRARGRMKPLQRLWGSKVQRTLFLGFVAFQILQFYLNQRAASGTEAELLETLRLIKSSVAGG